MAKSLLTMIGNAADEIGIGTPTLIFGNTDSQVKQLLALANREGKEFAAAATAWGGWPQMRKEHIFTLTTAVDNYAFPSDWQFYLNQTQWDRSNHWQLLGPLEAQEWQVLKSGLSPTGPRRRFRIMASRIYIDPVPVAADNGLTMAMEYISTNWCQSAALVGQSAWAADTDLYVLDEDCFILGLKWRWKAAKGLDYSEERMTYEDAKGRAKGRAGGARTLPLNALSSDIPWLLTSAQIPDSGFG